MSAFCLMILKCQKYACKQHLSIIHSNSNESLAPSLANFKYPGKFPSLKNRWKQEVGEPSKLRGYIKLWVWKRNWNSPNHFNFHLYHLSSFSKSKLSLSVWLTTTSQWTENVFVLSFLASFSHFPPIISSVKSQIQFIQRYRGLFEDIIRLVLMLTEEKQVAT